MDDQTSVTGPFQEVLTSMLQMSADAAGKLAEGGASPRVHDAFPLGAGRGTAPGDVARVPGRQAAKAVGSPGQLFAEPARWLDLMGSWYTQMPMADPKVQQRFMDDGLALWQGTSASSALVRRQRGKTETTSAQLPRDDKRFADASWREQPLFALIHQTYLMLAEQIAAAAASVEGLDPERQIQLRFATQALVDALSPSNFALTNPQVLQRAIETKGENLVKGMENLLADMRRGRLRIPIPRPSAWADIAVTPGKVVYESPLFQLIQYTPPTDTVLATPLIVFPPWINRFYILDLNPQKSFVHWAVEQGLTTFMVSWKSADASMADVVSGRLRGRADRGDRRGARAAGGARRPCHRLLRRGRDAGRHARRVAHRGEAAEK